MDNGTLVVASSGLRTAHVDPWGRTTLHYSYDNGHTWSELRVINDSPIDDRDAGIVNLGGNRLLVSWFTSDTKAIWDVHGPAPADHVKTTDTWTGELIDRFLGSYVMLSEDAGWTWGSPIRIPISAPHGPILLDGGDVLYLGKQMHGTFSVDETGEVTAYRSSDGGQTWRRLGNVPSSPGVSVEWFCEPHVVELPSGKLLGAIRLDMHEDAGEFRNFNIVQTESNDGGLTWSEVKPLGFHGSPPHLLRHSSSKLIMTYGYRMEPFGQRVAISSDEGATWEHDWVIRDDGPSSDLGYPSTVELPDGSLISVYYQQAAADEHCSLLWSHWTLPE